MPEICGFYGIVVYVFYNDHPPPHFHAVYGEHNALMAIDSLSLLAGFLPPRAMGLVVEWASIHRAELEKVWNQAVNRQQLDKITPLG